MKFAAALICATANAWGLDNSWATEFQQPDNAWASGNEWAQPSGKPDNGWASSFDKPTGNEWAQPEFSAPSFEKPSYNGFKPSAQQQPPSPWGQQAQQPGPPGERPAQQAQQDPWAQPAVPQNQWQQPAAPQNQWQQPAAPQNNWEQPAAPQNQWQQPAAPQNTWQQPAQQEPPAQPSQNPWGQPSQHQYPEHPQHQYPEHPQHQYPEHPQHQYPEHQYPEQPEAPEYEQPEAPEYEHPEHGYPLDPIAALDHKITAIQEDLQAQIDDLACAMPVLEFFDTNAQQIILPSMTNQTGTVKLYEDFCVLAGQTVDLQAQVSPDLKVEDLCMGIYKDDVLVAQACSDDSQEPSSLMVFFRETVAEDSSFYLGIFARTNDRIPMKNLQFGVRIFGECANVQNQLPADCAEDEVDVPAPVVDEPVDDASPDGYPHMPSHEYGYNPWGAPPAPSQNPWEQQPPQNQWEQPPQNQWEQPPQNQWEQPPQNQWQQPPQNNWQQPPQNNWGGPSQQQQQNWW